MIVGIDPGKKGGVTALGTDGSILFSFDIEPGLNWMIACCEEGHIKPHHVFVEKAQAMPKQGVSSVFTYGCGFGEILGVLKALRLPYTLVTPRRWTKQLHVGTKPGKGKTRSFQAAGRLFPSTEWMKSKDGRYESALIALYGHRFLRGETGEERPVSD